MGRKRKGPPPSRVPRTAWQVARDTALAAAGYTKKDVHAQLVHTWGDDAPSRSGVSAVLDNRYRDKRVEDAFLFIVCGAQSKDARDASRAHYFPDDEPLYRSPPRAEQPDTGRTNAA